MGDSIIATMDTYDQRVYAIGRGPSAVKVEAPMNAIPLGSSVVIRGSVTDVSPGTQSDALTLRFPNGVPAVSDASMSEWMLYVYKQFPRPIDVTGVDVTLNVVDSNGNFREIGKTTADSSGFFSYQWSPDIEGKYTVIASFAGTNAYYGSFAETAFAVDPAAEKPAEVTIPTDNSGTYAMYSTLAIIAAIAVVGAILAFLLRKR